jgi:hypothetical protein
MTLNNGKLTRTADRFGNGLKLAARQEGKQLLVQIRSARGIAGVGRGAAIPRVAKAIYHE